MSDGAGLSAEEEEWSPIHGCLSWEEGHSVFFRGEGR